MMLNLLLLNASSMYFIVHLQGIIFVSLFSNPYFQTVSKAELSSMKAAPVFWHLIKHFSMCDVKAATCSEQSLERLKPAL